MEDLWFRPPRLKKDLKRKRRPSAKARARLSPLYYSAINNIKSTTPSTRCSVPLCSNSRFGKGYKTVALHEFPREADFIKSWIATLQIDAWPTPQSKMRICSHHFVEDDFVPGSPKILRPDAIPTRNLPSRNKNIIPKKETLEDPVTVKIIRIDHQTYHPGDFMPRCTILSEETRQFENGIVNMKSIIQDIHETNSSNSRECSFKKEHLIKKEEPEVVPNQCIDNEDTSVNKKCAQEKMYVGEELPSQRCDEMKPVCGGEVSFEPKESDSRKTNDSSSSNQMSGLKIRNDLFSSGTVQRKSRWHCPQITI